MRRRRAWGAPALAPALLALALAATTLAWSVRAAADPRGARIGYLANEPTPESTPVLRRALRELGWEEGKNLTVWYRYAQGRPALFAGHVDELLRAGVDLLVAASPPAVEAARRATTTIPIVMVTTDDPVANGLVADLARPGGNLTGVSLADPALPARRLEILKQVVPAATRVGVIWNPSNPTCVLALRAARAAARALSLEILPIELAAERDFKVLRRSIRQRPPDGLLALADPLSVAHRRDLATLAARNRVPAIFPLPEFVDAGGLMAYGPDWSDAFRRTAVYVDKILRGTPPGELALERQPLSKLHVNLRAARALGLGIPGSLLGEAARVLP